MADDRCLVADDRDVNWDGFFNARDLGGLPISGGGVTRRGAIIRSATLALVTAQGWRSAYQAGVRTVLDLREAHEREPDRAPEGITTLHAPLDDQGDTGFWTPELMEVLATPLYYRPFLAAKADRCAAAVTAIAGAGPGGVIVHCGAGRDRTGLVSLLLLALVGVDPEAIVADHSRSGERLAPLFAARGEPDQAPEIVRSLAARGTDARSELLALLDELDAGAYLAQAGVSAADLAAIRARLVA